MIDIKKKILRSRGNSQQEDEFMIVENNPNDRYVDRSKFDYSSQNYMYEYLLTSKQDPTNKSNIVEKVSKQSNIDWNKIEKLNASSGITRYNAYIHENGYLCWKNSSMYCHKTIAQIVYGTISENQEVHHINGNRLDNRIENLEVLDKFEHFKLHYGKTIKGIEYIKTIMVKNGKLNDKKDRMKIGKYSVPIKNVVEFDGRYYVEARYYKRYMFNK